MKNNCQADHIPFSKKFALDLHAKKRSILSSEHKLNYLMWECTLRCNLSCKHCGSDCRNDPYAEDMPLADFIKVVDGIVPYVDPRETMIVLTGGEPLLRDDLEDCGIELYRREFPWGIVTNGFELNSVKLDKFLNAGLRAVTVSLDGLEDTHNLLRNNDHSFHRALNAIRILGERKNDLVFDVVTCVTKINLRQLEDLKELLIWLGVKNWRILTVSPLEHSPGSDRLMPGPEGLREVLEFIRHAREENLISVTYGCEGFLGNYEGEVRDGLFFCRAGINVASVRADGSISGCPNIHKRYVQGNIYKDDFIDVWNNKFRSFRNRMWMGKGECSECRYFKYCEGNSFHLRDGEGNLQLCHMKYLREAERALEHAGETVGTNSGPASHFF